MPRDQSLVAIWRKTLGLNSNENLIGMICINHFDSADILPASGTNQYKLRPGAAPTIFAENSKIYDQACEVTINNMCNPCLSCGNLENRCSQLIQEKLCVITKCDVEIARREEKIQSMVAKIHAQAHDIAYLKRNLSYSQDKVKQLKQTTKEMEKKIFANQQIADALEVNSL